MNDNMFSLIRDAGYHICETARPIDTRAASDINFINHGGVAIFVKQYIRLNKLRLPFCVVSFEYTLCELKFSCFSLLLLNIYRPGSCNVNAQFFY